MTETQDDTLAAVTARAGLPASPDERRYKLGQGAHTEHQLRTLVEGVPHLIWRSCDRGLWTWASPQWMAYTGQTQEGSHGRGWLSMVHPGDLLALLLRRWAKAADFQAEWWDAGGGMWPPKTRHGGAGAMTILVHRPT